MIKISIVIPTYNEAGSLESCIESLGYQTDVNFEIIVVDDGSTDKTSEVLRDLQLTISNFQFFIQKHEGAGAARNLGAKNAKGKILVFVDADMTFDKSFLSNLVKPIERGEAKGTFSRQEYVANWNETVARCWNINEGWESRRRHPKDYPYHQPVFRAILKSEFRSVEGFNPGGYDDDWSLSKKLGYEALAAPGAIFYHKNSSTLVEVYKHAKWVGKRKYKYGYLGYLAGLLRASLPISLIIGTYKSIRFNEYLFLIFKIVYDFGIFVGILEFLISGKSSK
jgi:glycosyltransferase involved in cell wall biosynthesis